MGFDRLAAPYAVLESLAFQGALQRARTEDLDALSGARRALILGEGDGRFLEALARRRRASDARTPLAIDVVESSAAMRERTRRRLPDPAAPGLELRWIEEDARGFRPEADAYDVIVTHFFLDCFTAATLDELVPRLAGGLREGGTWTIADFRMPASGFGRVHAAAWLAVLHAFFRRTAGIEARRLTDPATFLSLAGLRLEARRTWRAGLVAAERWRAGRGRV
ncbi:MAG: class I SAM-dependent methyltransferase [Planctomycetota bacterium]